MMYTSEVLVTTSNGFEHATIRSYHGIISNHVVAGANIFSDIAASFSDFFGGRSGSYQNKIDSIKNQALSDLKVDAQRAGANAVISVSMDVDEVSGQNKSMFMITVYGTAVTIDISKQDLAIQTTPDFVSGREVAELIERKRLYQKYATSPLEASNEDWGRILELSMPEIASCLTNKMIKDDTANLRLDMYLRSIDVESAKACAYRLLNDAQSEDECKQAKERIINLTLLDYKHTLSILETASHMNHKYMLETLVQTKQYFVEEDIQLLDELQLKISENFPEVVSHQTKKSMLGKERIYWQCCRCGQESPADSATCSVCKADKRGFKKFEVSPEYASDYLSNVSNYLKKALC